MRTGVGWMSTFHVDPTQLNAYSDLIGQFADDVAHNFSLPVSAQPEDQLKSPVGQLLSAVGTLTALDVDWRTEVHPDDVEGRPDIGVVTDGLLNGHVELKRPGNGARPEGFTGRDRQQWERFKALPNLIYTDGSEWSLYRSGHLQARTRIASDISTGAAKAVNLQELSAHQGLIQDFLYWEPVVPGTAQGLAEFLAPMARILRDEVLNALDRGNTPLRLLAHEWGGLLFPEADDGQFADAYAQTVTYALLLARFEGAESLRPARAVDILQREHGLLAEALQLLEAPPVRQELNMPIELLERAIGAVDSDKISLGGDPWLYFYEQFLGAYDPKLRKDRGVYYTPVQVVQAQVKLAGELLRTRFGKQLAYAEEEVVVLDPAVGTGTYPLAVLDHASEMVRNRLGPGAVAEKLRSLAARLYAFEILVGPYSVAHLRLSQSLKDAGVLAVTPKVYLTDTLESPNQLPEFTASLLQAQLTEERTRAQAVKKDTRVFVCLGNPPYDREERDSLDDTGPRKGGWVRYGEEGADATQAILEDFLKPAREAGHGVHLKNLYNDYVYFWRWALWKVFDSTEDSGIVTFITASSYLRGPGFTGMRRKMRQVFDELWIIDLEGDSIGARKTENVFAIRPPVAIAIGVRKGPPQSDVPAQVWKTRLTGSEQEKLARLDAVRVLSDLEWQPCSSEWDTPFYAEIAGAYFDWPAVIDVFPWQHSGSQMKRKWPIGEARDVLINRWRCLMRFDKNERALPFKETRDRKVSRNYPTLLDGATYAPAISALEEESDMPAIVAYAYRALDRHWVIADSRVGDFMRPDLWRAHGDRQVYLTSLLTKVIGKGPAACVTADIPDLDHFCGRGGKDVIPLWRNPDATDPNVASGLLEAVRRVHGSTITPERLFAYAYGILAQPAYVEQFWDELEQPPPRLPITKNGDLFQNVAVHGTRLLYLHTYGERFASLADDGSVPQGTARCTKAVPVDNYPGGFSYDSETQVLAVGDGEFAPLAPEVWNYSVSGFQVVKSWLDRRKLNRSGRQSSPLDEIRPEQWIFTEELLELLWVVEATLNLQPEGTELLAKVFASDLFSQEELPKPSNAERQPPRNVVMDEDEPRLLDE